MQQLDKNEEINSWFKHKKTAYRTVKKYFFCHKFLETQYTNNFFTVCSNNL